MASKSHFDTLVGFGLTHRSGFVHGLWPSIGEKCIEWWISKGERNEYQVVLTEVWKNNHGDPFYSDFERLSLGFMDRIVSEMLVK